MKSDSNKDLVLELFYSLIPWTNHFMHAVRISAQSLIFYIFQEMNNNNFITKYCHINNSEFLKNLNLFLINNSTCQKMISQQSLVANVDPLRLLSLEELFFSRNYNNEVLTVFMK